MKYNSKKRLVAIVNYIESQNVDKYVEETGEIVGSIKF